MPPLDEYLAAHHDAFERDLFELLRIESISAKSDHRADIGRAAQWVADHLQELGLAVELVETAGQPDRLCRIARRSRGADRAGLRPLRRAAGRTAGRVAFAAV